MRSFETLYETILKRVSENVPVDLAPGINVGVGSTVPVGFTDTANYKITPDQAGRVIDDVIDYLRTRNNHSPLPYRMFQTDVIANKIVVHTPLNPTKAKYAARVIYNAMRDAGFITDEKSGTKAGTALVSEPTPEEVDEVADTVASASEEPEIKKPEREKIEIPDEEEASVFFKVKTFPVEEVTVDEEEPLLNAWESLPEDRDLDWSQIVKQVGLTTANKLKDIKAILPTQGSNNEEEGGGFIEDDEYIDPDEVTDTDWKMSQSEVERELGDLKRTKSGYSSMED